MTHMYPEVDMAHRLDMAHMNLLSGQVSRKQKVVDEMSANPVKRPWDGGKPFVFRFPLAPKLNEEVSNLSHMTHGYGDNHLFNDVTFRIQPGERIAFLGPNGAGKSTLLRLVLGFEKPLEGKAGLFHRSVIANYFEQNQADALDLTKTVLQSVEEVFCQFPSHKGHSHPSL